MSDERIPPLDDPIQPHLFDNLKIPSFTWNEELETFVDEDKIALEVASLMWSLHGIVAGQSPLLVDDFKFKLWLTKQRE